MVQNGLLKKCLENNSVQSQILDTPHPIWQLRKFILIKRK
jgi:hypothetical protein